ncbi:MAG TPA: hypothetical protein VI542_06080 [Candidatus Tectomicrobia bacterium]
MTLTLSLEQSRQWDQGGWLSLELQETMLEDIERQHITEPVAVLLHDGRAAFAITPYRRQRERSRRNRR